MKTYKGKFDAKATVQVKHEFTTEELADLARKQGQLYQELENLEGTKSHVSKDFAARIECKSSELAEISNKTASGYEMRPTECGIKFRPAENAKDVYVAESGQFVETQRMQPADYQKEIPLEKPADEFDDDPPKAV
ncbi:MAG: hypothetical protein DMF62_03045 [Acidobacteria bacterium]|nr:MAG: hypothetical protein DMF62_03045 [Acidobacteriota bacterium]